MLTVEQLKAAREDSIRATAGGPPPPTQNAFFGVGPITDMARDEADSRRLRFEFEHWLELNYRKRTVLPSASAAVIPALPCVRCIS